MPRLCGRGTFEWVTISGSARPLGDEIIMIRLQTIMLAVTVGGLIAISSLSAGQDQPKVGFKDTPMLPGGKWHVHDGDRPRPAGHHARHVQHPGRARPPAVRRRGPVRRQGPLPLARAVEDNPRAGRSRTGRWSSSRGPARSPSKDEFGDCQLHLEFAAPVPPRGRDQGRGNSGVMFFGRYEIQVLDSFQNVTYADGQAAAIYGQYPPLVNASRPPGQWQTYDIIFTAPRFKRMARWNRRPTSRCCTTACWCITIPAVIGAMAYRAVGKYTPHGPKGPDRPPGPWQPRAVPQYLGPRAQGPRPALIVQKLRPDLIGRSLKQRCVSGPSLADAILCREDASTIARPELQFLFNRRVVFRVECILCRSGRLARE